MQKYVSKYVVCPFYHKEDGVKILCEGFCEATTSLQSTFRCREDLRLHKKKYCEAMNGFKKCPLYPAINRQYEEV